MGKVHELLLKVRSSFDGKFGENTKKIAQGFQSVEKQVVNLQKSQEKIRNLSVQVKGYEKVQNQMLTTKLKSESLTQEISQFKESLTGVEKGSDRYREIEKSIKSLEKEQLKATTQAQKFEQRSKAISDQLKTEGISTNKLSSEKAKLISKNKDLKEKIDKLNQSQDKNIKKTKDQGAGYKRLSGIIKTVLASAAIGFVMHTGLAESMNLEGYRLTLQTVMKDTQKAKDLLSWGSNFANVTPFENSEVVDGIVKLQSYGLTAKEVLPQVGDMAAVMGKSLDQGVEAIADAQAGELERLKEFGLTKNMIIEEAAKLRLGLVVNKKGQIVDQQKFNKAMFALMNEKFKGGMEKQATTMKGIWSTITGVTKSSLVEIFGLTQDGTIKQGSAYQLLKTKIKLVGDTLTKWQSDGTIKQIAKDFTHGLNVSIVALTKVYNHTAKFANWLQSGSLGAKSFKVAMIGLVGAYATYKTLSITVAGLEKAHTLWKTAKKLPIDLLENLGIKEKTRATLSEKIAKVGTFTVDKLKTMWTLTKTIPGIVLENALITKNIAVMNLQALWSKIVLGSTKALTAGQWLLNVALNANPIGLVIGGIALLATGLVIAYKKSETFRNILHSLWEKTKKLIEPLKTAVGWVEKLFGGGDKNITLATNVKNNTQNTDNSKVKPKDFPNPYNPNWPKPKPFAIGGIVNKPTFAEIGEGGDTEVVIPLNKSSRSKGLLNYAFNAINGNKKSPFDGGLSVKNSSNTQVTSSNPMSVTVQVIIQGVADTVEKAKKLGDAAGTAAARSFEKEYKKMQRNKRRLSLGGNLSD